MQFSKGITGKLRNTIAGILFLAVSAQGQPSGSGPIEKKIDDLLVSRFTAEEPGCAVLVARNNEIIYKKAFGSANMELNVALKPDMVFNIASLTKQFTAIAILQLVEENKLSLQDSLQKYIPDYPSKGAVITIAHLLTHTSGIKDYLQIDMRGTNMERWDFSPKQLIDSFKNYPLEFKPGARFSYSNSGYFLLGYIIEKITGKKYQDYLGEKLFKPCGMTHTYFDVDHMLIPGRVNGYRKDGPVFRNMAFWSPSIEYAAGGMLSNADDLLNWHRALYTYKILKEETFKKALTPYRLSDGTDAGYGFGWFIKKYNDITAIEHPGTLPGFQARVIFYPDDNVFMVILSNSGSLAIDGLANGISEIVLNKSLQPSVKVDDRVQDKYLGTYKLSVDTNRVVTILRMNGQLVAKLSNNEYLPLVFKSATKFQLKNLLNADCEFIIEKDRVVKIAVNQNGYYEWIKTQ